MSIVEESKGGCSTIYKIAWNHHQIVLGVIFLQVNSLNIETQTTDLANG